MERIYKENSSKLAGTYKITNKINGKIYIGSTTCFQVRASQHEKDLIRGKHGNPHLQNAFNKDGTDSFLFEVIEILEKDSNKSKQENKQIRLDAEQLLLDAHWDNCVNCYNVDKKSQSREGRKDKNPELSKLKRSEAFKGEKNPFYGRKHTQETLEKIKPTQFKKGQRSSSETEFKKGNIPWHTGKHWSEEQKKLLSKAHKGQVSSKKGKTNIELYGEERAKEIAKKISAAKKNKFNSYSK